ncbi:hypothetical protein F2Q69_00007654 [Brassica cretica]|uniref:RNase H type-1 domain-containing protein n=1 Tax=Brassica cretica TaxID=69181 RepID=A0A8S9PIL7_BRACR|nr:hypothetical protein F2Q69_00007654 [Brassica cretica]
MDGYAWTYTNSGTYYVKSRYNRLHKTKVCDAEVQLASIEAECWRKANLPEDGEKKGAHIAPSANSTPPVHPQCPTCQIDASWIDNVTVSGLGWFYNDQMGVKRFVLQGCRKSLSALYAELEGFIWIWAMSCLREVLCTTIHMETDCSNLVA